MLSPSSIFLYTKMRGVNSATKTYPFWTRFCLLRAWASSLRRGPRAVALSPRAPVHLCSVSDILHTGQSGGGGGVAHVVPSLARDLFLRHLQQLLPLPFPALPPSIDAGMSPENLMCDGEMSRAPFRSIEMRTPSWLTFAGNLSIFFFIRHPLYTKFSYYMYSCSTCIDISRTRGSESRPRGAWHGAWSVKFSHGFSLYMYPDPLWGAPRGSPRRFPSTPPTNRSGRPPGLS
jgi:hypothetical protein